MSTIQHGDRVCLHYTTLAGNGCTLDSSVGRTPLTFVVGNGEVLKGLEWGVLGLKPGDRHTLYLAPDDAFGERQSHLKRGVPVSALSDDAMRADQVSVLIDETTLDLHRQFSDGEIVHFDGNHPLAGQSLTIEVEILRVESTTVVDVAR